MIKSSSAPMRFMLQDILQEGERLELFPDERVLILMDGSRPIRVLLFTNIEYVILYELLKTHPYYVPHDRLLAMSSDEWRQDPQEDVVNYARKRLQVAIRDGDLEVLRPIRNVMSRVRIKLNQVGVTVNSILETGYELHTYHGIVKKTIIRRKKLREKLMVQN